MRGNQLCWDSDAAACPTVTAPGSAVKCADAAGTHADTDTHGDTHGDTDASAARSADLSLTARSGSPDSAPQQPGGEKHVIAPAVFVFQKMASATKRQAEDSEQGLGSGPGAGKRLRCFSFPSLRPRCRTGFCHSGRRMRSSSLCFPPTCPVSRSNVFMPSSLCSLNDSFSAHAGCPRAQRGVLLRPALLPAPQPWSCPSQPHLAEMVPGPAGEPCAETLRFCPTRTLLAQMPRNPRALTKTPVQTAGHVPSFVFGENMSERVLSPSRSSEDMSDTSSDSSDSELSDSQPPRQMAVRRTLWESAAAYTAACGRRCLLKRVQLFTGEEHESNVVQITCKLFVLEKGTQSWTERGRGVLRLNDLAVGTGDTLQSRIGTHLDDIPVIYSLGPGASGTWEGKMLDSRSTSAHN
ncbi:ran-binding protein 3-like isoform X2 [Scleropages formosus]|uniref:ran-binding protein 3-like isoform X2 n=1 Tax=Scleropages formosus TaxID=113540 RepID=UPI00087809C3|nr:ran-binding protein 3-like isoform X2 [Scleropages formosus]